MKGVNKDKVSLKELQAVMRAAPQHKEKNMRFQLHLELIEKALKEFDKRNLEPLTNVEQVQSMRARLVFVVFPSLPDYCACADNQCRAELFSFSSQMNGFSSREHAKRSLGHSARRLPRCRRPAAPARGARPRSRLQIAVLYSALSLLRTSLREHSKADRKLLTHPC